MNRNNKPETPYQKAKKHALRSRITMDDMKLNIRKVFKDRMKLMRSNSLDSFRHLNREDYIKSALLDVTASEDLPDPNELLQLLEEVETELLLEEKELEVSIYETELDAETSSIVENLISCKVCEHEINIEDENEICTKCAKKHFADNEI